MTSRNYCFTLNNPEALLDFGDTPNIRYAVYQAEIGENGTNHFQGYLELRSPQRYTWVQNNIPGMDTAHLEVRRGSAVQARDYAMKEDTRLEGPWEYGEFIGQGERMDIVNLKKDIDAGKTDLELWDNHALAFLRFQKTINYVRQLKIPDRNWEMENTYVYGKPGTGKTRYATDTLVGAYIKGPTQWWDFYQGGDVILDDFNGYLTWTELLRILDRYPMYVQPKGLFVKFTAHKIILTSNTLPSELYSIIKHPLLALTRRFTRWIYFYENNRFHEYDNYEAFAEATKQHAAVDHFPPNNAAYRTE